MSKCLSCCAWLLKMFVRLVRCLMMLSQLGDLLLSLLKVNCKDRKKFLLWSDWCSQGLQQAGSAEQSRKKYIEMIGQLYLLYKYNPVFPDSWWFSWEDFPYKQHQAHQAWWPCFSWLRSLADLKWQSCTVMSSSPILAASTLEQFWEVTAP